MEKVLWVRSYDGSDYRGKGDGLDEVNQYLQKGWRVKLLTTCESSDMHCATAYIVIEKGDENM